MSEDPIREPDQIRRGCAKKLRQVLFANHYQAILGCVLGENWTTPQPIELALMPDGQIVGRCDGGASFSAWVGPRELLLRNARIIAETCELDGEELAYLLVRVAEIKQEQ
jgi:hypothetical protein